MRAELMPALGGWLLTYLIHSTLLLGGAWLLTRRLVQTAPGRDLVWKAAMVGGLVSATLQAAMGGPRLGGSVDLGLDRVEQASTAQTASQLSVRNDRAQWGGLLGSLEQAPEPAAAVAAESGVPGPAVTPPPRPSLLNLLLVSYSAAALLLTALYLIRRGRAMRRIGPRRPVEDPRLLTMLDLLREGGRVRRPIRLTAAGGLSSPVALGWDEIVVPEAALTELDADQQRSLLAHELAHLARHDPAWLTLGCVMERLLFLQPLNHLARVRLQEAAEYLCDDWAVHRTGSGFSLASCLVKVAEWVDTGPATVPLAGMAERRSQLVTRVHRLIEGRAMSAPRSLWLLSGAVTLVALTAVAAPGISTGTQSPADTNSAAPSEAVLPAGTEEGVATAWAPSAGSAPELTPADTDDVKLRRTTADMRQMELRARMEAARELRTAHGVLAGTVPMAPLAPMPPSWLIAARAPRAFGGNWRVSGRQGDTTSIAVPALMAALKDTDVEVRRAAVQSLSNHEDRRAVPALIDALKDSDAEVRAGAAMALGQLEDPRAAAPVSALLKDNSVEVRRAALWALHNLPGEVSTDAVLAALADSDAEVRQAALGLALSRMSEDEDGNRQADPRYVAAFTRMLGDTNPEVRQQSAMALAESGVRQAPAALLALARDKNAEVRQQVASALGRIGDPKAVPTIKELLQDGNADVREEAVSALSEVRDRSALEALVGALKSSDPVVRRSAAEALGQREDER